MYNKILCMHTQITNLYSLESSKYLHPFGADGTRKRGIFLGRFDTRWTTLFLDVLRFLSLFVF